jgi:hypothetical protein
MAARKGKTRTAKVKSLESRRLDPDQAGQVKGGLCATGKHMAKVEIHYNGPR